MQLGKWIGSTAALFLALSAHNVLAGTISPDLGLTEMMMDAQGGLLLALAGGAGSAGNTTVTFTAMLDYNNLTFDFQTAPDSQFAGDPFAYSADGSMDGLGDGTFSGGGTMGGDNIAGDGNEKQSGDQGDTQQTVEIRRGNTSSFDVYNVVGEISYYGTNNLWSSAKLKMGGKKYDGTDHIKEFSDGGKKTTWVMVEEDSGGGGIKVDVSGIIEPAGFGIFTADITDISDSPEPSSAWTLATGCVLLGAYRLRLRPRHSAPATFRGAP
jgi:hypothetical protein